MFSGARNTAIMSMMLGNVQSVVIGAKRIDQSRYNEEVMVDSFVTFVM